jgi:flagellin-like hook-associated protein FlgL
MSVSFGSNLLAQRVGRNLETATRQVSTSFERLSSGMRINKGADDAAGLAISSSLNARSRIYGQSIRNINEVISRVSVASSTVSGLSEIVNRLAELSAQASNGTLSGKQRSVVNSEARALTEEYNRAVQSTQYQGIAVIDGTDDNLSLRNGIGEASETQVRIAQEMGTAAGDGTVGAATTNANGSLPQDVALADFNNDGNLDIASSDFAFNSVGIYLGTGSGSFGSVVRYSAGAVNNQVWDVATGDFNRDGRVDLATANRDGTMGVLLGNGNGTFQTAQTYAGATDPVGVAVGDLNNDGILDIVTNGNVTGMDAYLGKGDGTFTRKTVTSGSTGSRVAIGDLNGDGNQDLVSGGIFYGNGDGSFKSVAALPGASFSIMTSVITDLDKDGNADLVTATSNSVDGTVGVYMGTGAGSLRNPVHYALPDTPAG